MSAAPTRSLPDVGLRFDIGLRGEVVATTRYEGYYRVTVALCFEDRTVSPGVQAHIDVLDGLELPWPRVRELLCQALERDVLEALSIGVRSPEFRGELP